MNDMTYYQGGSLESRPDSKVANPFGSSTSASFGGNVAVAQAVSEEFSRMQARVAIAQQFPRDEGKAMDAILTACQRVSLAEKGTYMYKRGNQDITGPSIRLAEEIMRHWKHIEAGWKEVERREDSSLVECMAWDMASNIIEKRVIVVPHYRSTKATRYRLTDERDINEMIANQAARKLRTCILSLIPGDVIEAAVEQCGKTLVVQCPVTNERITHMIELFKELGVSQAQIEKRIQRKISAITPAQLLGMGNIYNSIHEGITSTSDWFEEEKQQEQIEAPRQSQTEGLKATLKRGRQKKDADPDPAILQPLSEFKAFELAIQHADSRESLQKIGEDVSNSDLNQEEINSLFKLIDSTAETKGL